MQDKSEKTSPDGQAEGSAVDQQPECGREGCGDCGQANACNSAQTPIEAAPQPEAGELEAKLAELDDKYKRLAAEYDNFRKRTQKERESLTGFVVRDTAAKFLPLLDSLNMAVSQGGDEAVTAGLALIMRSMSEVLSSIGIEEIPADGAFDPQLHNAVMHIEDPTLPENSVAEVLQKGYKYKDIVIRHVMVKVAN